MKIANFPPSWLNRPRAQKRPRADWYPGSNPVHEVESALHEPTRNFTKDTEETRDSKMADEVSSLGHYYFAFCFDFVVVKYRRFISFFVRMN